MTRALARAVSRIQMGNHVRITYRGQEDFWSAQVPATTESALMEEQTDFAFRTDDCNECRIARPTRR